MSSACCSYTLAARDGPAAARARVTRTPSHRSRSQPQSQKSPNSPRHRHPHPHRALSVDGVEAAVEMAVGAAAGVGLAKVAWPKLLSQLKPIRCANCRGMGCTLCAR